MPPLEMGDRRQWALLWTFAGWGDDGEAKRSALYIQLQVRWENRKSQSRDPKGNVISLDASVHADRAIAIGGVMWEGTVDQLVASIAGTGTGSDLVPTSDLFEVVSDNSMKDIKGRVSKYVYGLRRLKDSLPASA